MSALAFTKMHGAGNDFVVLDGVRDTLPPLEPLAAKLADEALSKAMIFADQLAMRQAEIMFKARIKNHGYGRGCLGITVDLETIVNPEYIRKLIELK